jgi:hypothetical protein
MNIFKRTKKYTEKDLISFGNHLLSNDRYHSFKKTKSSIPLRERLSKVHQSDITNWKDL